LKYLFNIGNKFLFISFWSLIIALAGYLIIYQMHVDNNWKSWESVSSGVVEGKPIWKAFQNKILMPHIISFLEIYLNKKQAFLGVYLIGIFVHNIIFLIIFGRISNRIVSLTVLIIWTFLFVMHQHILFYPWDVFEISLFLIVWYCLYSGSHSTLILILYPLALLNRESGLFLPIAYWMIKVKFNDCEKITDLITKIFSKTSVVTLILVGLGVIWTIFIREYLLIEEIRDASLITEFYGTQIHLFTNLKYIFINNWLSRHFLVFNILLFFFIVVSIRNILGLDKSLPLSTSVFFLLLLTSMILFSMINETRGHFFILGYYIFYIRSVIVKSFNNE
tara:strand:- start:3776 stop:4780 length:1005 start_codon:yes stop_codon:yes gene_type:complete